MKKIFNPFTLLLLVSFLFASHSFSQVQSDTIKTLKNTIRFNITNPLLFGDRYNVIGYERVLNKHQSISLDIGRFSLPKFSLIDTDSLSLQNNYSDKGFNIALDYRFYLRKENRYDAPRGVYIGPYYAFNYFRRNNTWSMNTSNITGDVITDLRLNLNLVGAQLGYQFIIKNRITVDMILFGPGIWFYNVKTSINTTLDPEDEALLFEKINEILAEKLPGNELVLKPGNFKFKGSVKSSIPGLRYIVHLGFRF